MHNATIYCHSLRDKMLPVIKKVGYVPVGLGDGKFSPGTHIPIFSESHFHQNLPDIAYLFAWNHREEIFAKEKDFIKKGGQWMSHVFI